MTQYIDFKALKERVTIIDALLMLDLKPHSEEGKIRCACTACKSADDRAIVVTPEKSVFYCHEAKYGGDCIALVAHIKGIGVKEAALMLDNEYPVKKEPKEPKEDHAKTTVWAGLDYLVYEHELMKELGFAPEDSEKIGIGFCNKGMMRGLVAIPIRLPSGQLIGYIGVAENVKIPRTWNM
jgi:DNA primase